MTSSTRPKRNSGSRKKRRSPSSSTEATNRLNTSSSSNSSTSSAMDLALATLQPLRDLARNWDVDVASCLEEYLQELAGIHPQQLQKIAERASTKNPNAAIDTEVPNFAHAALILQNSSNVYSRKVEYLYSLVYKALDEFFQASKIASSSSSSSTRNSRKGKSVDADVDEFFDFDPHECFLLLDDVVPEDLTPSHRKINLKEEEKEDEETRGRMSLFGDNINGAPGSASNSSQKNNNNNITRLSLGGLSVTRMERNNSFTNGNMSSQQEQRALLGILNNGSLRLMSGHCDVGDDGVLLMPGSQSANSKNRNSNSFGNEITNNLNPDNSLNGGCGLHEHDTSNGNDNSNNRISLTEDGMESGPRNLFENDYNADADNYEDDDQGPGFVMNDDFHDGGNDNDSNDNDDTIMVSMDVEETQVGACALASSQTFSTKRVAFADSVDNDLEKKQHRQQKKKKKDPWQLLDPHSLGDTVYKPKPLKRGKTYRLPEGIFQPPSECVTGSSTSRTTKPERQSLVQPTLRPSLAIENFRVAMGNQLEPSEDISIRGLAYGDEFLYIAKENVRLKAAKRREERKREQQSSAAVLREREGEQKSGDIDNNSNSKNSHDDIYDDVDDDDNGGGFDFGGGGENDCDYDGDQDYAAGNSGLVNLEDAFGNRQHLHDDDGIQNAGSSFGQSFEELCRAHIQAFAKSAEKFALTTKLTERISQWQAHLAPILEEEERKASFDIYRYSKMFLDASIETMQEKKRKSMDQNHQEHGSEHLCKSTNSIEFRSVAEGCTQSDICRLFLASLSLANSGNLNIDERALDYRFEVVSGKVDRPMETYLAPSTNAIGGD
uniref:Condensin-2 complex subunit H2 C-terminal domain-containing protein n=2 Tax=Pseudo-nitzschia australis TaxID=44445 RepID=A0A7S4AVB0_9STRA|mmetsp:Transcript_19934/g.43339  ORF Transcript_19934/g.43339 Transcript_19934/m.43339 type:complete len:835 (+) Transcript_19934:215-2719(+)